MNQFSQDALRHRLMLLDTPSLADAMDHIGIYGALQGIQCQISGQQTVAGPAFTAMFRSFSRGGDTYQDPISYIDQVRRGDMIVIDNEGRRDCTSWGDLLTEAALQKDIMGTVIHGAVRDISEIRRMGYPLFSTAIHMVGGRNRVRLTALQVPIRVGEVFINPGDWIVADSNGVLAIPASHVEDIVQRAERIDRVDQRIRQAVREGVPLEVARLRYRYEQPWDSSVGA
ncbi:RraA family protein [Parachitinimonas caeni]|uniref:Putative 4-hydroxy-4-methyl-2-oxoglutarate aldolase n=1 Tax=Parachitinimonas caeni TaxID=3031301 RepID=A0ABT7DSQ6_9NEIS|nr:RraA family protein [Parachitinimonas caeni]MDK2123095.1 RraA family protein [Parachitinimonas caeni]